VLRRQHDRREQNRRDHLEDDRRQQPDVAQHAHPDREGDTEHGPAPTSRREASTSACPAYRGNRLTAIVTGPMKTIAASTWALSSSLLTVVTSVVVSAQLKLTLARLLSRFQEG
jgi:hypothetical protein